MPSFKMSDNVMQAILNGSQDITEVVFLESNDEAWINLTNTCLCLFLRSLSGKNPFFDSNLCLYLPLMQNVCLAKGMRECLK